MGQKLLKLSCNKKWEWSAQEVGGYGAEVRELALGHSKVRGEQVITKEWALLKDLPSPVRPGSEWSAEFRAAEGSSEMRKMRTVHGF